MAGNIIPRFTGKVVKGRLMRDDPAKYALYVANLEGKRIEELLQPEKSTRSDPLNRYYFGVVVPLFMELAGFRQSEKDEAHQALKIWKASSTDEKGIIHIEKTSKMDNKRFLQYLDDIAAGILEMWGVIVPKPDEYSYVDEIE